MRLGGFGSSILEYFSDNKIDKNVYINGIPDSFTNHASRTELFEELLLDTKSIINKIEIVLNEIKK